MTEKMSRKQMNEIRDEIDRWYNLIDDPSWDENTTAMWAMSEEIVKLRKEIVKWRKIADDFAYEHRKRYGLDGAWDKVNVAYDKAVSDDQ